MFTTNSFAEEVATVSGGGGGGGTSVQEAPDSLRDAQVFAGSDPKFWQGNFWFNRHIKGEQDVNVVAEFILNSDFQVTYLNISDVILVDVKRGDKPWPGLPANAVGETRDFYLGMSGYAELSDMPNYPEVMGGFSARMLSQNQAIIVKLIPNHWYKHIDFSIPEGVSSNNIFIEDENGAKWGYNHFNNGFSIYLDPRMVYNLKIKDNDGIIYATMVIDPLAENDTTIFQGNIVNVSYPDGLTKVSFTNDWLELNNQKLNGKVANVPAHVYIVNQGNVGIYYYFANISNAKVTTYLWEEKGEMREIDFPKNGCEKLANYCTSWLPEGDNKIIIVVTGEVTNVDGFVAYFQKTNYY